MKTRQRRIFTPPDTTNYPINPGRLVENILGLCLLRLVKKLSLSILERRRKTSKMSKGWTFLVSGGVQ